MGVKSGDLRGHSECHLLLIHLTGNASSIYSRTGLAKCVLLKLDVFSDISFIRIRKERGQNSKYPAPLRILWKNIDPITRSTTISDRTRLFPNVERGLPTFFVSFCLPNNRTFTSFLSSWFIVVRKTGVFDEFPGGSSFYRDGFLDSESFFHWRMANFEFHSYQHSGDMRIFIENTLMLMFFSYMPIFPKLFSILLMALRNMTGESV